MDISTSSHLMSAITLFFVIIFICVLHYVATGQYVLESKPDITCLTLSEPRIMRRIVLCAKTNRNTQYYYICMTRPKYIEKMNELLPVKVDCWYIKELKKHFDFFGFKYKMIE